MMKANGARQNTGSWGRRGLLLAGVALLAWAAGRDFLAQRRVEPLFPGPGLAGQHRLADWHPALAGTRGDTELFRFAGAVPGGRVLVLGGSHPNEPAGHLAAVLLVENLQVEQGEIWVLPRANASAFTATDPQEGTPQLIVLPAADGRPRAFRVGGRGTNPLDQWPDPEITIHRPSGQALSGNEVRNLNRSFPGRADGCFTEQVAWAIRRLIEREGIDLLIDLHEAAIEYPVVNAVVAHEAAGELAAEAVFGLAMKEIQITLEPSPPRLRGLSHRELGDAVPGLLATLLETANPGQGRLRGRTDARQILAGDDPCYQAAAAIPGMNKVPVDSTGLPLTLRVGRHLEAVRELCLALGTLQPDKAIRYAGLPELPELLERGLSPWLAPAP
ncbi:MAG: succinylglutamate desuccinylase/aspartoacylase family protein [bacterium]|jgi:hypothetical protein|nr:succinylglutamate desuccinylase/aspartoacylase family protein [bacterium]